MCVNHSSREAPYLKMGAVFFLGGGGVADFALWMLISSQWAVEEQDVDKRCVLCLPSSAL